MIKKVTVTASLLALSFVASQVAFAAEPAMTGTSATTMSEGSSTPEVKHTKTVSAERKACLVSAKTTRESAVKSAEATSKTAHAAAKSTEDTAIMSAKSTFETAVKGITGKDAAAKAAYTAAKNTRDTAIKAAKDAYLASVKDVSKTKVASIKKAWSDFDTAVKACPAK